MLVSNPRIENDLVVVLDKHNVKFALYLAMLVAGFIAALALVLYGLNELTFLTCSKWHCTFRIL